jgi:hypothetical protein
MADVAVFGIGLEMDGATATVNKFGQAAEKAATASDKLETSTRRIGVSADGLTAAQRELVRRMQAVIDVAATLDARDKAAVTNMLKEADAVRGLATAMNDTALVQEKLSAATARFNQAVDQGTAKHANHVVGIGRIGQSLAALVGHAVGVPSVVDRVGESLSIFAVGHMVTVGILAGLALIATAFHVAGEEAHKLKKDTDDAVESLLRWKREHDQGAGGKFGVEIGLAEARLEQNRRDLAAAGVITARAPIGEAGIVQQEAQRKALERERAHYNELAEAVREGEAHVRELREKAHQQSLGDDVRNLAQLITAHKATAREMASANALVTVLNESLDEMGTKGGDRAKRAQTVEWLKELNDALHPKSEQRLEDQQRAQVLAQRLDEYSHFVREQQSAYKRTLDQTARDFEDEQDRETAIAIQQYNEQTRAAKAARDKQTADTIQAVTEQEKYVDDMRRIGLQSLDQMLTGGLRSWTSFFDTVFSLFRRLMARMEAASKDSGFLYKALGIGSAAIGGGLAGFQLGQAAYSDSHGAVGNYARGALGGAAAGALAGSAFGPIGTAVGALAGLAGGIMGVASAAKEARKRMEDMQRALAIGMEGLKAAVSGDQLGVAIAQINAEREQKRREYEDAYAGGRNEVERYRLIDEMNRLEDKRIQLLKEEYSIQQSRQFEDLQARLLAAQGHTQEAEAMRLMLAQKREREDLIKSFGLEIDASEASTLALLDQVQAQEKLKTATDAASASALNMVQGYRYQAQFFSAMTSRSGAGVIGGAGIVVTVPVTLMMPNGQVLAKTVVKEFATMQAHGDTSLAAVLNS